MVVIVTPMRTAPSRQQALATFMHGRDPALVARERKRVVSHLKCCMELYKYQVEHQRCFLHEHPEHATSWTESCVKEVLALPEVGRVTCVQCQFGQQALNGFPVKKPIGFYAQLQRDPGCLQQTMPRTTRRL